MAGLLTIYLLGVAQGSVLNSLVNGASQPGLLHEVFHDFRHAVGFPCH
ncbi:MAG: CbtB-domain containing protein [Chloroflexi bacterium]|nr:CbtB-domain containing protein [Chloroflexota bacterium]